MIPIPQTSVMIHTRAGARPARAQGLAAASDFPPARPLTRFPFSGTLTDATQRFAALRFAAAAWAWLTFAVLMHAALLLSPPSLALQSPGRAGAGTPGEGPENPPARPQEASATAQSPGSAPTGHAPSPRLVLAIPFENTSENRSLYWLGEALADGITRELRLTGGSPADRRDRVSLQEDMGIPPLSTMTLASQIRSAETIGAGTLVTGTFGATEETLTVQARVVDIATGRIGPWITVSGSSKDLLALQRDLFRALCPSLPPGAPALAAGSAEEDGVPQAAYESLLKSLLEDSPDKREKLLRRSLDLAPSYLRAKIELAQIYRESGRLPKAVQTLSSLATRDRALAADGENLLADIEIEQEHTAAAEAALRRSLAFQETARAHLLMARLAILGGDRALAGSELARSRELDPSDPDLAEVQESLSASP